MPLRLPYGLCSLITAVVFFIWNLAVIWIIVRTKKFYKYWAYRIIAHIAVTDVIVLFIMGVSGGLSVFNTDGPTFLAKICFSLSLSFKVTETFLCFILGLNRLFVLAGLYVLDRSSIYWVCIVASWGIGAVLFAFMFANVTDVQYFPDDHRFDGNLSFIATYGQANTMAQIVILGLSAVIYLTICVKIKCKKTKVSKHEFGLFIQALIPFVWFVVTEVLMHLKRNGLFDGDAFSILFSFFSRYVAAVHIIIYMIFNRTMRRELLFALNVRRRTSITTVKHITHMRSVASNSQTPAQSSRLE
ncbi:hypothetical protein QR680_010225 [Steinernema hermaphroditum]|uniref:Uncharacterized protein n=1 Tax=Steinernema hermaphroditum TaxID=289476 RepID=A0AA39IQ45_9BILA|nr:hypothetical protein QR680_010225 [Steinernema hermaphroditum]